MLWAWTLMRSDKRISFVTPCYNMSLQAECSEATTFGTMMAKRFMSNLYLTVEKITESLVGNTKVKCQAPFICANFKVVVSGIGGCIPRLWWGRICLYSLIQRLIVAWAWQVVWNQLALKISLRSVPLKRSLYPCVGKTVSHTVFSILHIPMASLGKCE